MDVSDSWAHVAVGACEAASRAMQASQETLKEMEKCARALARSVRYVGAATVEYLYDLQTGEYFFLELNPRLQVLHRPHCASSHINLPLGSGCKAFTMHRADAG